MTKLNLTGLSVSELGRLAAETREKLFRARMKLYSGKSSQPSEIRQFRRDVARIETMLSSLRSEN